MNREPCGYCKGDGRMQGCPQCGLRTVTPKPVDTSIHWPAEQDHGPQKQPASLARVVAQSNGGFGDSFAAQCKTCHCNLSGYESEYCVRCVPEPEDIEDLGWGECGGES